MRNLEPLLRDMGMKEYESKAWLALLNRGACTADAISKAATIPVTRVYETLENLEKRGLVVVQKTRPKKYRLISVDSLNNLIDEKKTDMENEINKSTQILKKIKDIVPDLPNIEMVEEKDTVWVVNGRENILRKIIEGISGAGTDILLFTDDFTWYDRIEKALKRASKMKIGIKLMSNVNDHTKTPIQKALSYGIKIRGWDMEGLMGTVIDNTLYLVSKVPRQGVDEKQYYGIPGNDSLFSYKCLMTRNPIIVKMFRSYYDSFWWRGNDPEKTL
jgi:sugar-specific transcriptional regulator TrmB